MNVVMHLEQAKGEGEIEPILITESTRRIVGYSYSINWIQIVIFPFVSAFNFFSRWYKAVVCKSPSGTKVYTKILCLRGGRLKILDNLPENATIHIDHVTDSEQSRH